MLKEPDWLKWHCVRVDIFYWLACKDWCYLNLGKLGYDNWNWSRFVSNPDERGYVEAGEMGFYFKNEEDAVAFSLSNKTKN